VSIRGRHRDYYLGLAERAEPELHGPNQLTWLDLLEAEHDNLRAALAFSADTTRSGWTSADATAGLRLAVAVGQFWLARGRPERRALLARSPPGAGATRRGGARQGALPGGMAHVRSV